MLRFGHMSHACETCDGSCAVTHEYHQSMFMGNRYSSIIGNSKVIAFFDLPGRNICSTLPRIYSHIRLYIQLLSSGLAAVRLSVDFVARIICKQRRDSSRKVIFIRVKSL